MQVRVGAGRASGTAGFAPRERGADECYLAKYGRKWFTNRWLDTSEQEQTQQQVRADQPRNRGSLTGVRTPRCGHQRDPGPHGGVMIEAV